eukprot:jgi/Ulvmu1/59/UM001_0062.1
MAVSEEPIQLSVLPEGVAVLLRGQRTVVPARVVEKSTLLRTLVAESDVDEQASIPIGAPALEAWLNFNSDRTAVLDANGLLAVVKAADFLDDALTASTALARLAVQLLVANAGTAQENQQQIDQIIAALPEPLALTLLRHQPHLHDVINAVPPRHHSLALRAHLPAIDTLATLALHTDMPLLCCRAARAAAAAFPHLTRVALTLTMPPAKSVRFDEETLRLLTTLPSLSVLELVRLRVSIVNARGIEGDIGPCFRGYAALRRLSLRGALASLQPLAHHVPALGPRLTALDLSANALTAGSFKALSHHIGWLTALRELSLAQTRLDEQAWMLIAPKLPPLATLNISDAYIDRVQCLASCDGALDPARFWASMENLDLGFGHLKEGLEEFGQLLACMPALRRLSLAHALPSALPVATRVLRDLSMLPFMAALDISACSLRLVESDAFAACMHAWTPSLRELRIRSADGAADAACSAMRTLCRCLLPSLAHLDLGYSDLRDEGAAELAAGLTALTALTALELQQVRATAEGAAVLAQRASVLERLEVLQLHGNAVLGEGLVAVVEAAGELPLLRALGLRSVCGPRGAPAADTEGGEGQEGPEPEGLVQLPRPLAMKGHFTLELLAADFSNAARADIERAAEAAGVTLALV